MKVYGKPGAFPSKMARSRRRLRALVGVVVLVLSAAAVLSGRPAVVVPLFVVGFFIRHRLAGGMRMADAGAAAEAEVAVILSGYKAEVVLFDVDLRGQRSDVDVVVLGPIVATIEVKRAHGRLKAMTDGTIRIGRTWLPGRPIAQAVAHAAAVGRFTEHRVEAVLCVTGMRQRPRIVDYGDTEVWVTNTLRLPRILKKLPRVVSSPEARDLALRLRTGNSPSQKGVRSVT